MKKPLYMKETFKFLEREPKKILVIDDADQDDMETILSVLKVLFPEAIVTAASNYADSEKNIETGTYDVILLDASLKNWGLHKRYDSYGWNMIPYIREKSKTSTIVAISNSDLYNARMLAEDADHCVNKEKLLFPTPATILVA